MSEEPNYPVIEVEAENIRLKDEIIDLLKKRVDSLENENAYLRNLVLQKHNEEERHVGDHAIAPPIVLKPKLRTMSEVGRLLEAKSLNGLTLKKSAEEVKNEVTGA